MATQESAWRAKMSTAWKVKALGREDFYVGTKASCSQDDVQISSLCSVIPLWWRVLEWQSCVCTCFCGDETFHKNVHDWQNRSMVFAGSGCVWTLCYWSQSKRREQDPLYHPSIAFATSLISSVWWDAFMMKQNNPEMDWEERHQLLNIQPLEASKSSPFEWKLMKG